MFFCIPLLVIPLFWSFSLLVCVLRIKKTILDILEISVWFLVYGGPRGIRTPDPTLRRRVLYPTELLTHYFWTIIIITQKSYVVNEFSGKM